MGGSARRAIGRRRRARAGERARRRRGSGGRRAAHRRGRPAGSDRARRARRAPVIIANHRPPPERSPRASRDDRRSARSACGCARERFQDHETPGDCHAAHVQHATLSGVGCARPSVCVARANLSGIHGESGVLCLLIEDTGGSTASHCVAERADFNDVGWGVVGFGGPTLHAFCLSSFEVHTARRTMLKCETRFRANKSLS